MKYYFISRFKKELIIPFAFILISFGVSFANEGYYQNIKGNLEFKTIAIENKNTLINEVQTIHGENLRVVTEAIIDSSDINGIFVNNYEIKIYFNRDSWGKIRELSSSLHGSKIVVLKNNKIISSPTIASTLDRSATLSLPEGMDMEWFLKGFVSKNPPKDIDSNDVYVQFLKEWLTTHQDDTTVLRSMVAYIIPNNDLSNCGDATPYLEQILTTTPYDFEMGIKMVNCLLAADKNKKALETANNLLQHVDDDIMKNSIVALLGEIYYRLGMLKEAIQQTEIALNFYKELEIPDLSDWEDTPALREEQKELYRNIKKDSISVLEKKVNSLRNELREGGESK